MSTFWKDIQDWMTAHKISAHSIAAALIGFMTLYISDPQVFAAVNGVVKEYPRVAAMLATAVTVYRSYANAKKILPPGNPPSTQPPPEVQGSVFTKGIQ